MTSKVCWAGLAALFLLASCGNMDTNNESTAEAPEAAPVQVIAHRGGAKLAPENTLAAIRQAVELGVDMIEIDVILSKDGEVIVIHDDKIDRTTDGEGIVKEMTLEEIRQYDAGSWFDARFAGEKVPTLDEVFEAIDGRTILLIEIKDGDEAYPGLEKKVVDAIHRFDAGDWVVVQSFNQKSVLRTREMDPSLITYYLMGKNFADFYEELASESTSSTPLPYNGIAVHFSGIDAERAKKVHDTGYKLLVWTVNEEEDMEKMMTAGVDGIITDRPDQLKQLMKE
ncbi:glycerophosphodiester phosphodiesterase [Flavilitoribacter nigricans]|uniref:GP-PDE domain-containing protein n=1 Tax=Flavilitoribacter nigricans (strain ATCC 23147 / DSM 23189 / NBRC 102662 / NCIMB 1420 / SS-2) TaxID=1122177 RepID=A0A2D0NCM4_FLAN2|nr:glycerophosphodiester phosphodiesterase family protein [Flavilitoribacter nigricans]PHN06264.1 hypothetical protein CRP01_11860 [Flavilitoribacter nigricans DSM 23189 = NBRC 102662]